MYGVYVSPKCIPGTQSKNRSNRAHLSTATGGPARSSPLHRLRQVRLLTDRERCAGLNMRTKKACPTSHSHNTQHLSSLSISLHRDHTVYSSPCHTHLAMGLSHRSGMSQGWKGRISRSSKLHLISFARDYVLQVAKPAETLLRSGGEA